MAVSFSSIFVKILTYDHASFYDVKDDTVYPVWQAKRVGTALMQELTRWLETNAANNALVALITRETLEPFFQQFDFISLLSLPQPNFSGDVSARIL